MGLLAGMLYYSNYSKEQKSLDERLYSQMRLCSFDLTCKKFDIDFKSIDKNLQYTLLRNDSELYAYFSIPKSEDFVLKISYKTKKYQKELSKIRERLLIEFIGVLLLIALLSTLFSIYSLYPLRSALHLTREFVRDIIHDVNTPLSALRLNASMLLKQYPQDKKIQRIEQAVENILNLQNNLRGYLDEHAQKAEDMDLLELVKTRIDIIQKLYPDIKFEHNITSLSLHVNIDAFTRVIDNLLNNAAKYNHSGGSVSLSLKDKKLIIRDTGDGIKDPKKIFKRFYTENAKGVGIGLHIVKKLCDMMHIPLHVSSVIGEGSSFELDLSQLTQR
jgi:signal transduction histidine kinase